MIRQNRADHCHHRRPELGAASACSSLTWWPGFSAAAAAVLARTIYTAGGPGRHLVHSLLFRERDTVRREAQAQ